MTNYKQIAEISKASQDKFELWILLELLDLLQPKRILEIGVHRGGMMETLHLAFPDAELWGIDTDFSFLEFTKFNAIAGDSREPNIRDEVLAPYDFIFIDGDHHYETVKSDYEMYGPMIRPGGIVGLHDINRAPERVPHHEGVEVRRFWNEVRLKHANAEIWNGSAGDDGPGIGLLFL